MIQDIIDTLSIPVELMGAYKAVTYAWDALPAVVKMSMVCCFAVACFFAILKMLF